MLSRLIPPSSLVFFFFNDTATTEIYTLSLHDALPIFFAVQEVARTSWRGRCFAYDGVCSQRWRCCQKDRKSTRLNSSHANISYAVFCLKKKKNDHKHNTHLKITNNTTAAQAHHQLHKP